MKEISKVRAVGAAGMVGLLIAALLATGCDQIKKIIPDSKPKPGEDAINIDHARQVCIRNGVNNPGLIPITVVATKATIDPNRRMVLMNYAAPGISGWNQGSMGDRMHMYFVDKNGKATGGHSEWHAHNWRQLTNIAGNGGSDKGGYWTQRPPKGSKVYFVVLRNDLKARTSVVEADIPWPW